MQRDDQHRLASLVILLPLSRTIIFHPPRSTITRSRLRVTGNSLYGGAQFGILSRRFVC